MAMDQQVGALSAEPELALGQRLQQARKASGLTQQQLCQKANLSYSTLAKIERGAIKAPSIFTIQSIAGVLGVSLDQLVGGVLPSSANDAALVKKSKNGIKFVYFDVNGCLIRFWQQAFSRIAEDTGNSADIVESVLWSCDEETCRGQMSPDEFNQLLAQRLGVPEIDWVKYFIEAVQPVPGMADLLEWVSQNYQVGLLTNMMAGVTDKLRQLKLVPDINYASVISSAEVGLVKPDPEIYNLATAKAGVSDAEILFIDDSRANLVAAQKQGWKVQWFDDFNPEQSIEKIKLVLELEQ